MPLTYVDTGDGNLNSSTPNHFLLLPKPVGNMTYDPKILKLEWTRKQQQMVKESPQRGVMLEMYSRTLLHTGNQQERLQLTKTWVNQTIHIKWYQLFRPICCKIWSASGEKGGSYFYIMATRTVHIVTSTLSSDAFCWLYGVSLHVDACQLKISTTTERFFTVVRLTCNELQIRAVEQPLMSYRQP